jgi:hypothetical protein
MYSVQSMYIFQAHHFHFYIHFGTDRDFLSIIDSLINGTDIAVRKSNSSVWTASQHTNITLHRALHCFSLYFLRYEPYRKYFISKLLILLRTILLCYHGFLYDELLLKNVVFDVRFI